LYDCAWVYIWPLTEQYNTETQGTELLPLELLLSGAAKPNDLIFKCDLISIVQGVFSLSQCSKLSFKLRVMITYGGVELLL
jgi:hypothetical protein